jgi:2-oxo-4-hydroxy-4-carboxy-5-ureidoimidazoline decarboxylase
VVEAREGTVQLNALSRQAATEALTRCCGARRWVSTMLALRPFASRAAVFEAASAVWSSLGPDDFQEAFSHHPQIGENIEQLREKFASTAELSLAEQGAALGASEATLLELRAGNEAYQERFGYSFIVCATGKTAQEMLALLQARLSNSPALELDIAAAEQAKITQLRLEKLGP